MLFYTALSLFPCSTMCAVSLVRVGTCSCLFDFSRFLRVKSIILVRLPGQTAWTFRGSSAQTSSNHQHSPRSVRIYNSKLLRFSGHSMNIPLFNQCLRPTEETFHCLGVETKIARDFAWRHQRLLERWARLGSPASLRFVAKPLGSQRRGRQTACSARLTFKARQNRAEQSKPYKRPVWR